MSDQEKISEYFEIGEARYFRKWFAHYLNYLSHDEALIAALQEMAAVYKLLN